MQFLMKKYSNNASISQTEKNKAVKDPQEKSQVAQKSRQDDPAYS